MAEDLGEVLKEVSGLLRRIADQHDKSAKRFEENSIRAEETREKMQQRMGEARAMLDRSRESSAAFQKSREEMARRMEESRETFARRREEDLEFRQRVLAQIERHNQLLETLISKLCPR